jgi:alpha-ribazole phosphatase
MEVYLVRHTETVCETGVCYGQSDVAIREPYLSLFNAIIEQLPAEAVLYTSPLQRCTILANYIQNELSIPSINIDDRLMEMDFGDWELKNWADIPKDILDPWMADFVDQAVPGGESFQQMHNRVIDFIDELKVKKSSLPVVIVTHSGVIRSVCCSIYGTPLKDAFVNKIDFGSVLKISL